MNTRGFTTIRNRRRLTATPRCVVALAAAALLFAIGCDGHVHRDKPPPVMPAVSHASAEEAARSWLLLTQTLIRARAHHDEAVVESAIAEMRRLIYLPGALLDRLAEVEKREAFERSMVDNWSAGIAYYTEGYQWDSLHAIAPPAADSPTVVEIAATGEEGGAVIAVHCVSTDQGWRVRSLGLLPEAKVAAPAGVRASGEAAPSSAPAPATQP